MFSRRQGLLDYFSSQVHNHQSYGVFESDDSGSRYDPAGWFFSEEFDNLDTSLIREQVPTPLQSASDLHPLKKAIRARSPMEERTPGQGPAL
jgi:hypothetical protein